jgi:hypothetical protein
MGRRRSGPAKYIGDCRQQKSLFIPVLHKPAQLRRQALRRLHVGMELRDKLAFLYAFIPRHKVVAVRAGRSWPHRLSSGCKSCGEQHSHLAAVVNCAHASSRKVRAGRGCINIQHLPHRNLRIAGVY